MINYFSPVVFDERGTEYVVGDYIDSTGNKVPIYQKTIQTTFGSNENAKYVSIGATIDKVVDYNAILQVSGNNNKIGAETTATAVATNSGRVAITDNSAASNANSIYLITKSSSWQNLPVAVTIQYTKTTD